MSTKMAFFSNRDNLKKSQHVKLKISLKSYNIYDNVVVAQQSLPPAKIQHYFPSVNVSKKFEQSLQTPRRKRRHQDLKIKAIENVITARHENNSRGEKVKENVYTEVKCRRERFNSESNEIIGVRNNRRASELVDQLLLDIYGRTNYTAGKIFDTEYGSSTSFKSVEKFADNVQYGRLILKDTTELRVLIGALTARVTYAGNLLVKQLKKREALGSKREKLCNVITAHLQAFSDKRSEDTNMRFSPTPVPGDSGFSQWRDAMKMVAKLPGGIPPEFRKKLWLALAEKHLQSKGVNWSQTERLCFNEWSNPDDNELGVQIVKDLHRTGCSLFCGAAGQENQALLKRVLLAYARWNKSVGYCQGFNMLAALILQVMDKSEIDSVKVMIYLIEGVLPESYFANNLRGLSVDMVVFRDLLRMRLPQLSKHLEALQNDAREGNSYEPPLTNVFTMQWFLTLFCNCLPQSTVLRVWDLIFLEGNEILLRTAIAIWEKLSDRILAVNSADEFYSIMGVLTREMLEFGLVDSNTLVKSIVAIGACAELNDMRDRYLYNITPWTQSVQTAAKKGLKLFYSDDDDVESDNDEKAAVTAVYGMSIGRKKERTMSGNVIQPYAHGHPDRERLALDISALKKQYAKLRERQRQAHIILQAACARQPMGQNTTSAPIAMNHLLLGKNAIVNARGRRLGPPKGAIPPVRTREPMKKQQQGETIHWKDTAKIRYPRRPSYVEESVDAKETFTADSDSSSYSEDDSSSTSTELCDEPGRMSDFDSDDKVSNIPSDSEKTTVDAVRTTKELKNTINSEKFLTDETIATEDNLNIDKSEASVSVNSEALLQDNKRKAEENVQDEENLFSEFQSSEKLEFKSTSEETETVTNEIDLCPVISESAFKMSEIDSDIFSNPVFYSEICNIQDTNSSDSKDNYVEAATVNESTLKDELDRKEQTKKSKLDDLEENKDVHIDTIPSDITEHNAEAQFEDYKFENPNEFNLKTPEEAKICEETMKMASEESKFSSDETNFINTDISSLGKQSETNYFDSSPIKHIDNSEASSSTEENMVENQRTSNLDFKLDDQKHKRICDEFIGEENVAGRKRHFDISPLTCLQNAEISSQTSLFTSENIEPVDSSNTVSDTKEEKIKIQQSQTFELTNIAITPEEDSISRIASVASDKNDKIQAMLNENSDILKGYQMGGEEKRNLELKLDETNKKLVDKQERNENYLLEFDSKESNAVLVRMENKSTPEKSTKSYDFEYFLDEQVKLLKQNSSESVPTPKEERSSEEGLRRHRSYEETTKNYMDRSTFYKQTSFDTRSSPIEEWTPYHFKEHEETRVNTKTEEICTSALDTFENTLKNQEKKVDRKLDRTPVKEDSCEEIVVKQQTPEWIPYNFEENKIGKHEEKQLDIKLNKYSNTLDIFEESGTNEDNIIKIDVNLAETPVTEEVSKDPFTKQPSIDLLSVDDTRLEAGRKNSARALKIIQENSLILHRILQHSKSSDKEDSEDELSRSPISKTFKSESLLSREERTDEDRSSRDGDEDLESVTEFSLSPAVLEEESDTFVRKSTEEKFSFEYKTTDESAYETFSDKSRQIKDVSSFTHADETSNSEERPSELFTLKNKDTNNKFQTEFSFQTENQYKLSSDFGSNEVDNMVHNKDITSKQFRSENKEDNLEILPEISSYSGKKLSAIESETHVTKRSTNKKLEKRYSSWHEEMSPDIPALSRKQFSSSFSFRSPEEEKSHLSTYSQSGKSIYTDGSSTLYLQESPEKINKTSSRSEYNLDEYKLPTYSARIHAEPDRNVETRNDSPVYQKEDSFTLSKGTNDYVASSHIGNEGENIDNNSYASGQSSSYSKSYSEFQYNRNRLTIDLSTPETSSPSHLSCLQFATDIPCTSKSLQFSPICVKDKTNLSPTSPSSSNNKYSLNLPTLSAPKRSLKSPLSPAKSFNPFPVQPTTRQPKEVGVRLGLYKDLSPLKSPAK